MAYQAGTNPGTEKVNNAVQTADIIVEYTHPNLFGGKPITLSGFKTLSQLVSTEQALDNSTIIPLVGGGSIQIVNSNEAGTINFASLRLDGVDISADVLAADAVGGTTYDVVRVARAQRANLYLGAVGASIVVKVSFNNITSNMTFNNATVRNVPPLMLAGNDVPDYAVRFNYSHVSTTQQGVAP